MLQTKILKKNTNFHFVKYWGKKVRGESTSEEISFECMVIVAPAGPRAQLCSQ